MIVFSTSLVVQNIDQRRLGALDLRRDDRFLPHETVDEPVDRRHQPRGQVQPWEQPSAERTLSSSPWLSSSGGFAGGSGNGTKALTSSPATDVVKYLPVTLMCLRKYSYVTQVKSKAFFLFQQHIRSSPPPAGLTGDPCEHYISSTTPRSSTGWAAYTAAFFIEAVGISPMRWDQTERIEPLSATGTLHSCKLPAFERSAVRLTASKDACRYNTPEVGAAKCGAGAP